MLLGRLEQGGGVGSHMVSFLSGEEIALLCFLSPAIPLVLHPRSSALVCEGGKVYSWGWA